jgi:hypothetical protein
MQKQWRITSQKSVALEKLPIKSDCEEVASDYFYKKKAKACA